MRDDEFGGYYGYLDYMYSTPLPIPEEVWNVWHRDVNSFTKMKSF